MEYDAVIFCRKRSGTGTVQWPDLEARISETSRQVQRQLLAANGKLSAMDTAVVVVVMGKCLEHYSSYYPDVFLDGRPMSVEEAIGRMQEVIDAVSIVELLGGRIPLRDEFERIVEGCLTHGYESLYNA